MSRAQLHGGARTVTSALLSSRPAALMAGVLIIVLCSTSSSGADAKGSYALRWASNGTADAQWTLQVSGVSGAILGQLRSASWNDAQWQKILVTHAEQGDALGTVGMPAVLGRYRVETNRIEFEPRFPLEPGVKYVTSFFPARLPGQGQGGQFVSTVFELPRNAAAASTVVSQIFPSADVLPENLLKFYVHFSAPMSRGHIYEHIHLRNEAGRDVELPFLEIDEELWNPELTRLTLFIDPGRIKRGVQPLEEIGPALEEGKRYTLIIDAGWKDGRGVPLKQPFQKLFRVGTSDREPVQPLRWKLQSPRSTTREPLTVHFGESLDHALAQRVIYVVDEATRLIPGAVALRDRETQWQFTPTDAWHPGPHALVVQNTIEDIAGNNVGKTFEVDLFEGVQRRFTNTTVRVPFEVR